MSKIYAMDEEQLTFLLTINFLLQMSVVLEGLSDGGVMMGISRQDAIQMAAQSLIVSLKKVSVTTC